MGEADQDANSFYSNFDARINFIPLKQSKKLAIGVSLSAQLIKIEETKNVAGVEVPISGYDFFYDLYNRHRIVNFSVSVGYTF